MGERREREGRKKGERREKEGRKKGERREKEGKVQRINGQHIGQQHHWRPTTSRERERERERARETVPSMFGKLDNASVICCNVKYPVPS